MLGLDDTFVPLRSVLHLTLTRQMFGWSSYESTCASRVRRAPAPQCRGIGAGLAQEQISVTREARRGWSSEGYHRFAAVLPRRPPWFAHARTRLAFITHLEEEREIP